MDNVFFESWESLARTAILTTLGYLLLVFLLRGSGKRTLSKMNAFDFIVTIALGSSLASVCLSRDIPLADGFLVFFLLIFLQLILTWLTVRVKRFKELITAKPTLLLYDGKVLTGACRKERIPMEEIRLAARQKGMGDLQEVKAMILETTGDITVISDIERKNPATLKDVENWESAPAGSNK